jgi:hypothetical protein
MDPDKTFFDTDQLLNRGQQTLELIRRCWTKMAQGRVNPGC